MAGRSLLGRLRGDPDPTPPVTLVASVQTIDLKDRSESARLIRKGIDQSWQDEAWQCYDSIGEVGFLVGWLATAVSRMRLFAAVAVPGIDEPVDLQTDVDEAEPDDPLVEALGALGPALIRDALAAIVTLGSGDATAIAELLARAVVNLEVPGEFYLVGYTDEDAAERWEVRSIGEVVRTDDGYMLSDRPTTGTLRGASGLKTTRDGGPMLDPADSYLSRIWRPHPRWSALADSPMRRAVDRCEELLLLGRKVRTNARSRLAAGVLAVPSELDLARDKVDPITGKVIRATPFDQLLMDSLVAPIADETAPSSIVPIIVKGPAVSLDSIRKIDLGRGGDKEDKEERAEALDRVLQALSGPKEVVTSFADVKYANALAVDRQSFRYHVQPAVETLMRAITTVYLRVRLTGLGHPKELIDRLHIWYDPAALVTNPDQGADAQAVYDAGELSGVALRAYRGFDEADAPSDEERARYLFLRTRGGTGHVPGVDSHVPGVTDPGIAPPGPAVDSLPPGQPAPELPAAARLLERAALTAAGGPVPLDLGARLIGLDVALATRTLTAAEGALAVVLSRAGARVRTRLRNAGHTDGGGVPNDRLVAHLGRDGLERLGLAGPGLLDEAPLRALATEWVGWARSTHERALRLYAGALGLTYWPAETAPIVAAGEPDVSVRFSGLDFATLREDFERRAAAASDALAARLVRLAEDRLYDPDGRPELGEVDTTVPYGLVRGALAVAGGAAEHSSGVDEDGRPVAAGDPPPGELATGVALRTAGLTAGLRPYAYRWEHGLAARPFHPHAELDGAVLHDQSDERVRKDPAEWPTGTTSYYPGDHPGCSCHTEFLFTDPFAGLTAEEARRVRAAQKARDVRGRYVGRSDHPDDTPGGTTTPGARTGA